MPRPDRDQTIKCVVGEDVAFCGTIFFLILSYGWSKELLMRIFVRPKFLKVIVSVFFYCEVFTFEGSSTCDDRTQTPQTRRHSANSRQMEENNEDIILAKKLGLPSLQEYSHVFPST
jgi:hypothetical protein